MLGGEMNINHYNKFRAIREKVKMDNYGISVVLNTSEELLYRFSITDDSTSEGEDFAVRIYMGPDMDSLINEINVRRKNDHYLDMVMTIIETKKIDLTFDVLFTILSLKALGGVYTMKEFVKVNEHIQDYDSLFKKNKEINPAIINGDFFVLFYIDDIVALSQL